MKRPISVLDQSTIDKIAAGEVVERPASVVKELVENAIDAGASAVTVEIKGGGISFIRITDNGSGIERDQVPLAFLRHATSKIRQVEDLAAISSLGFRGEALSSIAAVSQVELITKPHEDLMGTRYVIEGGQEKSIEDVGAPDGTTFLVRNLFYNTPARAKFLKTPATESGYISSFIEQLSLSHPHISFKFIQDGKTKLHTSGNDNLREVIYQVYGREITRELIEVHSVTPDGEMEISGFIGKPAVNRGNRNFENYYVNGRYVKSKVLMKAIEDAYHTFTMQHKYPFTSLDIQIRGEDVDVNVHPTKMEVRFSRQEEVYRQVYQTIRQALHQQELIPEVSVTEEGQRKPDGKEASVKTGMRETGAEPFELHRRRMEAGKRQEAVQTPPAAASAMEPAGNGRSGSALRSSTLPAAREDMAAAQFIREQNSYRANPPADPEKKTEAAPKKPVQMELFDGKLLSQEARSRHRIIGQVFDTYWLVQMEDKLYIIDQHAAHEKVLYERFVAQMKKQEVSSQLLSPPLIISLNLQEQEKLKRYLDVFASLGFEIEAFGGKEYSIRAVPQNLYGLTRQELFTEILDHLDENPSDATLEVLSDRLATMACKAAVKGNTSLSAAEARALIDELLELENPYNCPHGRPTIISMSKYELEKKFKRIV
ncbi:MAG TPA: DNA mismatch repair endonuclease MutL [Candidatus Pullilachnospira intestinigallinarum]|nr:DNA mismatch repair endonuclease MutL [Candidatus Pullilachnospira intestinigallinarum]